MILRLRRISTIYFNLFFALLLFSSSCVTTDESTEPQASETQSIDPNAPKNPDGTTIDTNSAEYPEMNGEINPLTEIPEDGEDDFTTISKKIKDEQNQKPDAEQKSIEEIEAELENIKKQEKNDTAPTENKEAKTEEE